MRQANKKLRHGRKAFWWLKIKKGEKKKRATKGEKKSNRTRGTIKVLTRLRPVGLRWVTDSCRFVGPDVWQSLSQMLNKQLQSYKSRASKQHHSRFTDQPNEAGEGQLVWSDRARGRWDPSSDQCGPRLLQHHGASHFSTGDLVRSPGSSNARRPFSSWEGPSLRERCGELAHRCTPSGSVMQVSVTPWTIVRQAPLSLEFSGQEYWSGLSFLNPGDFPSAGIKPTSPASLELSGRFLTIVPRGRWDISTSDLYIKRCVHPGR